VREHGHGRGSGDLIGVGHRDEITCRERW
jgi:hypothetical protein